MFKTILVACVLLSPGFSRAAEPIEEIIVTGEFREARLRDLPASVSVLQSEAIEARAARHLGEILALAANVNVAGGSSRSRFFQIRGIGERSQFAEPLNPSVGLIVDGVDLSAAAAAATLFDVAQVEVFRGPQGTRYGANALAGLINVRTRDPTETFEARLSMDAANYDAWTLGGAISGPLGERVSGRLAMQQHSSDGFVENDFLGVDDTSERDELSLRGKLRWLPGVDTTVDAMLGYVDLDNGYDVFSLDNDRTTLSDQPGVDRQETLFGSVEAAWEGARAVTVEASLGASSSDSTYGYDEDWTFVGFHPDGYSSTDYYLRDRESVTGEVRLLSKPPARLLGGTTDWVVGVYALDRSVDFERRYTFNPGPFTSTFGIDRLALFGQLETALGERNTLTTGLRYERHESVYDDSEGVAFAPEDDLVGWRVSFERALGDAVMAYATVSQGYKAGGFNTDGTLDADLREYQPETLINYELGLKGGFLGGRLNARFTAFYMQRDDVQIASSIVRVRDDGSAEFIDFIGNAAKGTNAGIEAELNAAVGERLEVRLSVGLLDSEYEAFVNARGENLDGREQAHAPGYQFAVSASYAFSDAWSARIGVEGRDAFYFSDSHNVRSDAYELVNASIGWLGGPWEARLWARNLTDEEHATRGFFFGNDPRIGYAPRGYVQLAEPRRVGLSVSRAFQ